MDDLFHIAGRGGESHQQFTASADSVTHSLRMLCKEGNQAHVLDAIGQTLVMRGERPPARRLIVLLVAENRDRASTAKLPEVLERA